MLEFAYRLREVHVVFAHGAVNDMAAHVEAALGTHRALVVSTPGRKPLADQVLALLGERGAASYNGARLHVPRSVVAEARDVLSATGADSIIAVGGGSAVGVAKALVAETGLPLAAVPTTYSGSEMTDIWGSTGPEGKRTGRDPRVAPRLVVYDPQLTRTMPTALAGPSGVNAIAHSVEALYSRSASPVSSALAAEGIRRMASALPAFAGPQNGATGARLGAAHGEAHAEALCGAHLCGVALDMTTMGLHHKLCHVLGGTLNLPHALTHAIVLPHATAYNAPAAADAMSAIADALGADSAPAGLWDLNKRLGIDQTLADLGMREEDIGIIAEQALRLAYPNPAEITEEGVRGILERAFTGTRPY